MLAVYRASEICIGIVSAGVVLAGTDFGGARRRLADAVRGHFVRDHRPVHGHVDGGRSQFRRHSAGATGTHPATHRARPGHRRSLRQILAAALSLAGVADGRRWSVRGFGELARGGRASGGPVGRPSSARRGCCSARHTRGAAIRAGAWRPGSSPGRPGALDRRSRRSTPDFRGCSAAADCAAGKHAVAAAARGPNGRSAGGHFARAERAGSVGRRSCSAGPLAQQRPASRARLASLARQCRARFRRDRRRPIILDRHSMAERRGSHHFCRDRRHSVRATSRPSLCHSHRLYDRDEPYRRSCGDHRICGAAEFGDLCRFQPRDRPCSRACRARGWHSHGRRRCLLPWRRILCRCSPPPTR